MSKEQQQNLLQGIVIQDVNQQTVCVLIQDTVKHPKYGKYLKKKRKVQVHDVNSVARKGDLVSIRQTKPISKTKSWEVVEIVQTRSNV